MAGVYIHIPFCKSRCIYCDFFSGTLLARKEALLAALHHELAARAPFIGPIEETPIETLYIGGGTPSLLAPHEVAALVTRVREIWPRSPLHELTLEANPDDLTPAYLDALRRCGINRLSIGIQSFHDSDLRWMRRRHDAGTAIEAVHAARSAGFENLSIDLIYGLPRMTLRQWDDNLTQALALRPEHLSAYHLTIEPGTALGRLAAAGVLRECAPEKSEALFLRLRERLLAAGYEHYEVSNFALPGYRARHNSSYWHAVPYLGVGPAAHSFNGSQRVWNRANLEEYLTLEPSGMQCEGELLTPEMAYDELVMTRLRTADGLSLSELSERFGARKLHYFETLAQPFLARGQLRCSEEPDGRRYAIPGDCFLISDRIIAELFWAE